MLPEVDLFLRSASFFFVCFRIFFVARENSVFFNLMSRFSLTVSIKCSVGFSFSSPFTTSIFCFSFLSSVSCVAFNFLDFFCLCSQLLFVTNNCSPQAREFMLLTVNELLRFVDLCFDFVDMWIDRGYDMHRKLSGGTTVHEVLFGQQRSSKCTGPRGGGLVRHCCW